MSIGGYFALDIPREAREIHIYRTTKNLRRIIQTGLLNMHQTGTSSFDADSYRRLTAEDKFAGLRISRKNDQLRPEDKSNFLRPKYGILEVKTDFYFGVVENTAFAQLGQVTVVLKSDVIKRTTYTYDDSLLMYEGQSETLSKSAVKRLLRPLSEAHLYLSMPANYFETQVWGKIDLRDVKEWIVGDAVTAAEINILKESGLPIYRQAPVKYGDQRVTGRLSRERGKLLFPGDMQIVRQLYSRLDKSKGKMQGSSSGVSCQKIFSQF